MSSLQEGDPWKFFQQKEESVSGQEIKAKYFDLYLFTDCLY